jgi:hypothetical protein
MRVRYAIIIALLLILFTNEILMKVPKKDNEIKENTTDRPLIQKVSVKQKDNEANVRKISIKTEDTTSTHKSVCNQVQDRMSTYESLSEMRSNTLPELHVIDRFIDTLPKRCKELFGIG